MRVSAFPSGNQSVRVAVSGMELTDRAGVAEWGSFDGRPGWLALGRRDIHPDYELHARLGVDGRRIEHR